MTSTLRLGSRFVAGAAAAVLAVSLAACGTTEPAAPDPGAAADPATAPSTAPASPEEFCATSVDIESTIASSPPPQALPPDQVEAVMAQQAAALDPLFTKAEEVAPEQISADVTTLVEGSRAAFTSGDFAATETPEFATANTNVDQFLLAECGFEQTSVTAVDFEFQGLPDSVPAGASAVTLANEGEQFHEIAVARINDGVDLPAEELLMLPMEESLSMVELVGIVFAPPGETESTFIDATPGRYVAVCFIPEGTTETAEGTGPPHFTLGMLKEFTVA